MSTYSSKSSFSLTSKPTCVALHDSLILTGHSNGTVSVISTLGKIISSFKAQPRKTTNVVFGSASLFFSGGNQGLLRAWSWDGAQATQLWETQAHESEISGIAIHPTGKHLVSCGTDKKFAVLDVTDGTILAKGGDDSEDDKSMFLSRFCPFSFCI